MTVAVAINDDGRGRCEAHAHAATRPLNPRYIRWTTSTITACFSAFNWRRFDAGFDPITYEPLSYTRV